MVKKFVSEKRGLALLRLETHHQEALHGVWVTFAWCPAIATCCVPSSYNQVTSCCKCLPVQHLSFMLMSA
eukprot:365661-Chlamydomonas_euryale.AAC.26